MKKLLPLCLTLLLIFSLLGGCAEVPELQSSSVHSEVPENSSSVVSEPIKEPEELTFEGDPFEIIRVEYAEQAHAEHIYEFTLEVKNNTNLDAVSFVMNVALLNAEQRNVGVLSIYAFSADVRTRPGQTVLLSGEAYALHPPASIAVEYCSATFADSAQNQFSWEGELPPHALTEHLSTEPKPSIDTANGLTCAPAEFFERIEKNVSSDFQATASSDDDRYTIDFTGSANGEMLAMIFFLDDHELAVSDAQAADIQYIQLICSADAASDHNRLQGILRTFLAACDPTFTQAEADGIIASLRGQLTAAGEQGSAVYSHNGLQYRYTRADDSVYALYVSAAK